MDGRTGRQKHGGRKEWRVGGRARESKGRIKEERGGKRGNVGVRGEEKHSETERECEREQERESEREMKNEKFSVCRQRERASGIEGERKKEGETDKNRMKCKETEGV